ncbi:uncharacterized protein LOC142622933 isoform X2 [Castanea sativa]|uniref:uncharacterized protein LOC142622933 isoform X2 n=1 Tax=Castanea sativa TaxID=21020 RepID=UPI003F64FA59
MTFVPRWQNGRDLFQLKKEFWGILHMHNSVTGKSSLVYQFEPRTSHSACSLSPSTLSLALCHHSPSTLSLALCNHSLPLSISLTLPVQSPSSSSISRRCRNPGASAEPSPYPPPLIIEKRFFYGWLEHDGQQRALNQSIRHKVYWTKAPSKLMALNFVNAGPSDDTQLRWQLDHQSTPLWRHTDGEEVPGTVKCRRCKCVLPRGGLDPHITQFIDATGFIGLFKVLDMEVYTQFS